MYPIYGCSGHRWSIHVHVLESLCWTGFLSARSLLLHLVTPVHVLASDGEFRFGWVQVAPLQSTGLLASRLPCTCSWTSSILSHPQLSLPGRERTPHWYRWTSFLLRSPFFGSTFALERKLDRVRNRFEGTVRGASTPFAMRSFARAHTHGCAPLRRKGKEGARSSGWMRWKAAKRNFTTRTGAAEKDGPGGRQDATGLEGVALLTLSGENWIQANELWDAKQEERVLFAFATHFADLTTWEYARVLKMERKKLQEANVKLVFVGIGTVEQAKLFCQECGFEEEDVYCDPRGENYRKLGFNRGFAPDANVSGYLKLLAMLAGLGSPGTIPEVLRGYLGDKNAKPWFSEEETMGKLFKSVGVGYQRPFELATVRLQNMVSVLSRWKELSPENDKLLTQLGGTLAFRGSELVYRFDDRGILVYADVDELIPKVTA